MELICFYIVFIFGLFLIWSGFMMFLNPEKVKKIIATAGSTYFINYTELILRLLVGFACINVKTHFELVYTVFGYFLVFSAFVLMLIPIKKHNGFSVKASAMLKPLYLKMLSPISVIVGILVIYGII